MAERTDTKAKNIALLELKLKSVKGETGKKAIKAKIDRLKKEIKEGDKDLTAKQLADRLLRAKKRVAEMSDKEFNEMIKRLSGKPEYKFLKSMTKTDIERDLARQAKPVGWRFKGKNNYKKPTAKQVREGRKNGTVYFENRANRSDVSRVAQLGGGGKLITKPIFHVEVRKTESSYWETVAEKLTEQEAQDYVKKHKGKYHDITYNVPLPFKGGGALEGSTYVPNRNIEEITLMLKGELKKVKGTEIFEGVHVKTAAKGSSSPSVTKLKARIKALVEKHDDEESYYIKKFSYVKDADLKAMRKGGMTDDMIVAFYCGVNMAIDFKGDTEMGSWLGGIFSYREEVIEKQIDQVKKACKDKEFLLGMKYPSFNFDSIVKKYKLGKPKKIKGEKKEGYRGTQQQETIEVRVGEKLVAGKTYSVKEWKKDGEVEDRVWDERGIFEGGYMGFVSSDPNVLWDVLTTVANQKDGYVKDVDFPLNGLGGVYPEELKYNDIEFEHGGKTYSGGGEITYIIGFTNNPEDDYTQEIQRNIKAESEWDAIQKLKEKLNPKTAYNIRIRGFVPEKSKSGSTYARGGEIKTLWKIPIEKGTGKRAGKPILLKKGTKSAITRWLNKNRSEVEDGWSGIQEWHETATVEEVEKYNMSDGGSTYARGGMVEHGLEMGDTIIGYGLGDNTVVVEGHSGKATVNLNTGERFPHSSMSKGGSTDSGGGAAIKSGSLVEWDWTYIDTPVVLNGVVKEVDGDEVKVEYTAFGDKAGRKVTTIKKKADLRLISKNASTHSGGETTEYREGGSVYSDGGEVHRLDM